MAGNRRTFEVQFLGDVKDLQRSLRSIDDNTRRSGQMMSNLGQAAKLALSGVALSSAVEFGRKMDELATQGEQTRSRFDTVFGDISDDMRQWIDEQNEAFGLSEEGLMGMAAGLQDLLVPLGFAREDAAGMTEESLLLANALSEFTGRDAAEAVEALGAAFTGERERLKGFGVVLTEADVNARLAAKGLDGLTGEALKQARAQATLELAVENSTDALAAYENRTGTAIAETKAMQAAAADAEQTLAELLAPETAFLRGELALMAEDMRNLAGAAAEHGQEVSFLESAYEFVLGDGAARAVEDWYDAHRLWNREAGLSAIRMRELRDEAKLFGPGSEAFAEAMRSNVQTPTAEADQQLDDFADTAEETSTAVAEATKDMADKAAANLDDLAGDIGGIADAFAGAEEEVEITLDEMISNVEEDLAQQQEFVAGLERLYASGMDDVADMFREKGPEALGAMESFFAGPLEEQMRLEQALENARQFGSEVGPATVAAAERAQDATAARWSAIGRYWAERAEAGFNQHRWSLRTPSVPTPGGGVRTDVRFNARGGRVREGDWSVVGEEGPELVRFGADGRVFPTDMSADIAANTRPATASMVVNVHVSGSVVTERDLVESVRVGLIEAQRNGFPVLADT